MTSVARGLMPKEDNTPPQPERNNAPSAFVTTTEFSIDDSGLTVDFGYPTGTVTIVVYDESNQIVCTAAIALTQHQHFRHQPIHGMGETTLSTLLAPTQPYMEISIYKGIIGYA